MMVILREKLSLETANTLQLGCLILMWESEDTPSIYYTFLHTTSLCAPSVDNVPYASLSQKEEPRKQT